MAYRTRVIPAKIRRGAQPEKPAKAPKGTRIIESCLGSPVTEERVFCNLSPGALEGLGAISCSANYLKGALLFVEGQEARGVFIIGHGRIKLSTSSAGGKSLILRIADAGEVIGLPGTISGKPHEVTAESLEAIQATFIPKEAFLRFLRERPEVAFHVAEILSEIYLATYREIRHLGLSNSSAEKLARFLLDFATSNDTAGGRVKGPQRIAITFTHQEIGQMIGSSRETVTRLFADFKRRRLLEVHGATLIISSRSDLEKIACSER